MRETRRPLGEPVRGIRHPIRRSREGKSKLLLVLLFPLLFSSPCKPSPIPAPSRPSATSQLCTHPGTRPPPSRPPVPAEALVLPTLRTSIVVPVSCRRSSKRPLILRSALGHTRSPASRFATSVASAPNPSDPLPIQSSGIVLGEDLRCAPFPDQIHRRPSDRRHSPASQPRSGYCCPSYLRIYLPRHSQPPDLPFPPVRATGSEEDTPLPPATCTTTYRATATISPTLHLRQSSTTLESEATLFAVVDAPTAEPYKREKEGEVTPPLPLSLPRAAASPLTRRTRPDATAAGV